MVAQFSIASEGKLRSSVAYNEVQKILSTLGVNHQYTRRRHRLEGDAATVLNAIEMCHRVVAGQGDNLVTKIEIGDWVN